MKFTQSVDQLINQLISCELAIVYMSIQHKNLKKIEKVPAK